MSNKCGRKLGYKLSEESKKKIGEANKKRRREYIDRVGKDKFSEMMRENAVKSVEKRRLNRGEKTVRKALWCSEEDHNTVRDLAKKTGRKMVEMMSVIVAFFKGGTEE